jgi:hypothetical protein
MHIINLNDLLYTIGIPHTMFLLEMFFQIESCIVALVAEWTTESKVNLLRHCVSSRRNQRIFCRNNKSIGLPNLRLELSSINDIPLIASFTRSVPQRRDHVIIFQENLISKQYTEAIEQDEGMMAPSLFTMNYQFVQATSGNLQRNCMNASDLSPVPSSRNTFARGT